jgi:hypothetical protein
MAAAITPIKQFVNPADIIDDDPIKVAENIRETGGKNLDLIQRIFSEWPDRPKSFAIALTGSDGRLERTGNPRNVELIVITEEDDDSARYKVVAAKIHTLVIEREKMSESIDLFHPDIEEKNLGKDSVSQYTPPKDAKKIVPIPTRALDAQFIAGDQETFRRYKLKLRQELSANTKICRDFKKDFLKPSKKNLSNELEEKGTSGVSLTTGQLTSDGAYARGPKYGMMRSIQYAVADAILRNSAHFSDEEFLSIPPTILERIDFLEQKNLIPLNPSECEELKRCYTQSLFWYAKLENASKIQGAPSKEHLVNIAVDKALLRNTLERTQQLVEKLPQQNQFLPGKTKIRFIPDL